MTENIVFHNVKASDGRTADSWATYSNNVVPAICDQIDSREPMGPTFEGQPLWPVEAVYDPETNKTRVGFTLYGPREDAAAVSA